MSHDCFMANEGSVRFAQDASAQRHARWPRVDDRRVISGIVQVLKFRWALDRCAGGLWSAQDTLQSLRSLGGEGRMDNLFHALATVGGPPGQGMIDSSAVKTKKTLGKTMQELTDEVRRELGEKKRGWWIH